MYLIKCDCGCFFTVKALPKPNNEGKTVDFVCQNPECKKGIHIYNNIEPDADMGIYYCDGVNFSVIPDNARVNVSFDM